MMAMTGIGFLEVERWLKWSGGTQEMMAMKFTDSCAAEDKSCWLASFCAGVGAAS